MEENEKDHNILNKSEILFRKNLYKKCNKYVQAINENKKDISFAKNLQKIKQKSLEYVFLKIDDIQYQNSQNLLDEDIQKIKLDKKKFMNFLVQKRRSLFPLELINFNIKKIQKQKKIKQSEDKNKDNININQELNLDEDQESSENLEDDSNNIWDSDFGSLGDHFEESHENERDEENYQDEYD